MATPEKILSDISQDIDELISKLDRKLIQNLQTLKTTAEKLLAYKIQYIDILDKYMERSLDSSGISTFPGMAPPKPNYEIMNKDSAALENILNEIQELSPQMTSQLSTIVKTSKVLSAEITNAVEDIIELNNILDEKIENYGA